MSYTGRAFLVVDDDVCVAASVARLVRRAARRPADAVTSFEAARLMLEDPSREYCGLVLDIVLGAGEATDGGFQLLDIARRRWAGIPAVILSGHREAPLINRAARTGATYLVKPASLADLEPFLVSALVRDRATDPRLQDALERALARSVLGATRPGELLRLAVAGHSPEEIVEAMDIGPDTYAKHVRKVLRSTGGRTLADVRIDVMMDALGAQNDAKSRRRPD